jgi:malate synthase
LYQYARHNVTTAEGTKITADKQLGWLRDVAQKLSSKAGKDNKFELAAKYFATQVTGEESKFQDFLTTMLYDEILELKSGAPRL